GREVAQAGQPGGNLPRRSVEIVDVVERLKLTFRDRLERALDRVDDIEKTDLPTEKSVYRGLVCRIEHGWAAAAADQRLAGNPQRRKALLVRLFEGEPSDRRQVEPLGRGFDALRPSQRIGDRRSHVVRTKLRQHRAVAVS